MPDYEVEEQESTQPEKGDTEIEKALLEKPGLELERYGEFTLTTDFTQSGAVALADKMMRRALAWQEAGKKPIIRLTIYSYGGNYDACMYLASTITRIRRMGFEVETYVSGGAYSAGFILAQFGTRRIIDETATAHIHTLQVAYMQPRPDVFHYEDDRYDDARRREMMARIFAERNTAGRNDYKQWLRKYFNGREHYFTAREALELGMVDEVVPSLYDIRPMPATEPRCG